MEEERNKLEEEKLNRTEGAANFREPSNSLAPVQSREEYKEDNPFKARNSNKIHVRSTISLKKPGRKLQNEDSQYMAELCCKLRASFLLYISMILLSFLIKKFEYIRPLLNDLRILMTQTNEKATGSFSGDKPNGIFDNNIQSLANIQIYLKNLKEIANSLLSKVEAAQRGPTRPINPDYSDDEDANDPFLRNFRSEPDLTDETKEKLKKQAEVSKAKEEVQRKMDQFMILWMRQIVIYNTHYVLHLALTNSNMTSILDVRPSIIKASNIRYALLSLMNPRLQSIHQVNNFKSMKRVLDNIVTYFFHNFITTPERALISADLQKVRSSQARMPACNVLKFSNFFESTEEFKKFFNFMDLSYYMSNVIELEMSLVRHTAKEY